MAGEITVNTQEEFQEMIDRKDFRIAKAIVESILENIRREIVFVNINREEGEYEYYEWDSQLNKYKKSEHND